MSGMPVLQIFMLGFRIKSIMSMKDQQQEWKGPVVQRLNSG